jgi:hypothetical protein
VDGGVLKVDTSPSVVTYTVGLSLNGAGGFQLVVTLTIPCRARRVLVDQHFGATIDVDTDCFHDSFLVVFHVLLRFRQQLAMAALQRHDQQSTIGHKGGEKQQNSIDPDRLAFTPRGVKARRSGS